MTDPYSDPIASRPVTPAASASATPVRRGASNKWGWIAGLVILALIAAFVFTREGNNTTTTTAPPAAGSAPAPSGASIPPSTTSQPPASGQPSPQGPTGPINTQSGGAPAGSPQGETPPNMQSAPQGSQAPAPSEQSRPTR